MCVSHITPSLATMASLPSQVTMVLAVHDKPALEHEMLGTTFAMETMLRAAVFTHQSVDTFVFA